MKGKRLGQDLGDYLASTVYPSLYARLDSAFPEYGWKRTRSGWTASSWPADFPFSVNHERPNRLMVYENRPHWIKVHGHKGVRFLDLVNGGTKPVLADFLEAVRRLCDLAGVSFPEREISEEERGRAERREARRSALEALSAYAREALKGERGAKARAYLDERGLSEEDREKLGIGFYASTKDARKYLEAEGVDAESAKEAAVLWEQLKGYVLFSWADPTGSPLTIYGRWPGPPPEGRPKTIALPGEGSKGSPLYFDRARKAGHKDLVAVEGVIDAAVAQSRGDSRVVAYVAATFSGLQVETLQRYRVRSVTVVPDPDGGGDRGALSSVDALTRAGIKAFVAPRLPVNPRNPKKNLDPDEFILEHGMDAWRDLVENAVPGSAYRAQRLLEDVTPDSTTQKRRDALEAILGLVDGLRGTEASLDAEDVLALASERTGYSGEAIAEQADSHAERREKEEREKQLQTALREAEAARTKGSSPFEIARELRRAMEEVQAGRKEPPEPYSSDRLEEAIKALPEGRGFPWKSPNLERAEVAFRPGELALVAARTSHGKTAFLVNLLAHWLENPVDEDEALVFFTAEEPPPAIHLRLLSLFSWKEAGAGSDLARGANTIRDYLRGPMRVENFNSTTIDAAKKKIRALESRLVVTYCAGWPADRIAQQAKQVAASRPVGAVLVDYLQKVAPPTGSFDRRDMEVTAIARAMKELSVDLSAPVIAGAQINRDSVPPNYRRNVDEAIEKEPKKGTRRQLVLAQIKTSRPALHTLREGGSEQEADLVLGLLNYAADYPKLGEYERGVLPFDVGALKNRHGENEVWDRLFFEGKCRLLRAPTYHEEGEDE